jgi:hypothetical protein
MLQKYSNMQLAQFEAMDQQIEVRNSRRQNIEIRNQWMRAQTINKSNRIRPHTQSPRTFNNARNNQRSDLKKEEDFRGLRRKSLRQHRINKHGKYKS